MISLAAVSKFYDNGALVAVNHVSLEIESGEKLLLRGPSGAGKSTLLSLIGTIDSPTSGEININDENLSSIKRKHQFRSKTIGFIFQFHHLLPNLTSLENVELPLFTGNMTRQERRDRAMGLLESVGIENKYNKLPGQLSGGERQRIAVARALVNSPPIILADEPTGNLDPANKHRVLECLIECAKQRNATLVLVTHDHDLLNRFNRVIDVKTFSDGELT
jgi:putative ABC transport system ATP-binding protein